MLQPTKQSFAKRRDQIEKDVAYKTSDIIVLGETCTLPADVVIISDSVAGSGCFGAARKASKNLLGVQEANEQCVRCDISKNWCKEEIYKRCYRQV
ncbi:unnamed protein product [Gongylonema pulchrum]|uniref:DUF2148 domain-containing protein n=1 Tax=Gongylonema pulchrum TaxID=637853 RepID=A0A183EGS9_9BILA|nr:unnamed protein product [Gongylonema pulchrum]